MALCISPLDINAAITGPNFRSSAIDFVGKMDAVNNRNIDPASNLSASDNREYYWEICDAEGAKYHEYSSRPAVASYHFLSAPSQAKHGPLQRIIAHRNGGFLGIKRIVSPKSFLLKIQSLYYPGD